MRLLPEEQDVLESCRESIERHSKSFSFAARLLPAHARTSAVALYAWCRRADDAVDDAEHPDAARAALRELREELDLIYEREASATSLAAPAFEGLPAEARALSILARHTGLPREYASELLAGMEMDLENAHYRSMDDLLLYCHRAAGVVGLMMCHVLGVKADAALRHAADLGTAMQLTNICRDVAEDLGRGRLYLPAELLRSCAAESDVDTAVRARVETLIVERRPEHAADPKLRGVIRCCVRELLRRADALYASGDAGLLALDARSAFSIKAAREIYAGIGDELGKQNNDPFAGRAFVSKGRKLRLAAKAAWFTIASLGARRRDDRKLHAPNVTVHFADLRKTAATPANV